MKRIHITSVLSLAIALFAILTLPSCEDFRDHNGDLGGMWQLTEWRSGNEVIKTNKDSIYYSVHRELIQYSKTTSTVNGYDHRYFSRFRHTPDSLIVCGDIAYAMDKRNCSLADLKDFGVPADGRFHINRLDSDHLVLSYPNNTLVFRKY